MNINEVIETHPTALSLEEQLEHEIAYEREMSMKAACSRVRIGRIAQTIQQLKQQTGGSRQ